MEAAYLKTTLYDRHAALGAKMVVFGGWLMPLWYPSGAVTEHRAVITNAGLFDTSHMSGISVTGPDSLELLQLCAARDLETGAALVPGRSVYSVYLDEHGRSVDDTLIYRIGPEDYISCVNAGMGDRITALLEAHKGSRHVRIEDLTGSLCKFDLQGPASARILMKCLMDAEAVLTGLKYFRFRGHYDVGSSHADTYLIDGTPVMLSRTGYTGEFGFEILIRPDNSVAAWELLLRAGEQFGLIACGLAARDSLRAGATLPLSHQDIGDWPFINNPWDVWLPFNEERTAFTKSFIGAEALLAAREPEHTYPFVGADPRKVSIADPAIVLDAEGREIGVVMTCVADMAIGRHEDRIYSLASPDKPEDFKPRGLVCGFVRVGTKLAPGRTVELRDNRRSIQVTIVDDIRPDRTARRPIREMM